jgi:hypothetical protein
VARVGHGDAQEDYLGLAEGRLMTPVDDAARAHMQPVHPSCGFASVTLEARAAARINPSPKRCIGTLSKLNSRRVTSPTTTGNCLCARFSLLQPPIDL